MLVSLKGIESFMFIKGNLSKEIICHFLTQSLQRLKVTKHLNNIKLVMDNCTIHKTNLMLIMAREYNIHVIFPPAHNPYFNVIEFVFRMIKSSVKRCYSMK